MDLEKTIDYILQKSLEFRRDCNFKQADKYMQIFLWLNELKNLKEENSLLKLKLKNLNKEYINENK